MPFTGIIKLKLKFFNGMENKITKSISYFSFILELKKRKKKENTLHETKTVQQWEKGKRIKKKKEEKRKDKKKID